MKKYVKYAKIHLKQNLPQEFIAINVVENLQEQIRKQENIRRQY